MFLSQLIDLTNNDGQKRNRRIGVHELFRHQRPRQLGKLILFCRNHFLIQYQGSRYPIVDRDGAQSKGCLVVDHERIPAFRIRNNDSQLLSVPKIFRFIGL